MGYKITYECDWPGCTETSCKERVRYTFAPEGWQTVMYASNYGSGLESSSAKKVYLCPRHNFKELDAPVTDKIAPVY